MKNKLTCIITDDEPFAVKGIASYVSKTDFLELVGVCEDGMELAEALAIKKPELVFLDIQMPQITGLELLRTLKNPPKIIFTTAYPEYAIESYELDVLDYLLKPISYERFLKASRKALDYFSSKNETNNSATFIFVKSDGKLEKIIYEEILYIQGLENYLMIHTTGAKRIVHATMKSFYTALPEGKFLRIHKSYIVAANKIGSVSARTLSVGGMNLPISRTLKMNVLAKLTPKSKR